MRLVWLGLIALLSACAPLELLKKDPPPAPAPKVTETQLREKAAQNFTLGLRQYESGAYDDALKNLTSSLDHGLLPRSEQASARKHLAFIHCLANRNVQCREEFRKAMEIDPQFDLTSAEAGHPVWGPVYRNVRLQLAAATAVTVDVEKSQPTLPRPEQLLADGLLKYEAGDFDGALKLLQDAYKEGLTTKANRIRALKHSAFSLCLIRKLTLCRNEFQKIFEEDADFDLRPAEAGHPSWAQTYASARARAWKARDKAARDAAKKK